jgi:hypothetical protein
VAPSFAGAARGGRGSRSCRTGSGDKRRLSGRNTGGHRTVDRRLDAARDPVGSQAAILALFQADCELLEPAIAVGGKASVRGSRHSDCRAKYARRHRQRDVAGAKVACQQNERCKPTLEHHAVDSRCGADLSWMRSIPTSSFLNLRCQCWAGRDLNRLRPSCTRRRS